MEALNSPSTVNSQYKTPKNLDIRISLHQKYSVNKQGFGSWILSHYNIPPNSEILELGCGNGGMWQGNLDVLNNGSALLLTDISEGMVAAAEKALGKNEHVFFEKADIESLPYENGSFDIAIANMMLYHVPDLNKGLSEVSRVLRKNGRFYCATFGENGIVPYISGLLKEYGAADDTNKNFTLQNGGEILKKYFSEVQRYDYEDSLKVTNIEDILDYIYTMSGILSIAEIERDKIKKTLEKNMVNGALNIPKENGMFVCEKKKY